MVNEKKKYDAIRIEFQERGSPHICSFIWIFNAPNIQNENAYIEFIEKTINAQLPDHLKDPELLSQFRFTKFMFTLELAGNTTSCLSYGRYFTEKNIITKPLDSKLSNGEKEKYITKASQKLYL